MKIRPPADVPTGANSRDRSHAQPLNRRNVSLGLGALGIWFVLGVAAPGLAGAAERPLISEKRAIANAIEILEGSGIPAGQVLRYDTRLIRAGTKDEYGLPFRSKEQKRQWENKIKGRSFWIVTAYVANRSLANPRIVWTTSLFIDAASGAYLQVPFPPGK